MFEAQKMNQPVEKVLVEQMKVTAPSFSNNRLEK
jgi:hypothetical protein